MREVVQIAGDGFQMIGSALERILQSAPQLQMILARHTGLQGMQVAQTAACNRLHDIQQRLSRWLLMTQDRVNLGILPITHDFIATMMGTDRSSVSVAAAVMQKKGIIEYVRGWSESLTAGNCRVPLVNATASFNSLRTISD